MNGSAKFIVQAAWIQSYSGPGWSNRLLHVCVFIPDENKTDVLTFQPSEWMRVPELKALAGISEEVTNEVSKHAVDFMNQYTEYEKADIHS